VYSRRVYTSAEAGMTFWQTLAISAFTAIGGGWISAWIALRRFRSEKWWERKADAYSSLVGSIHDVHDEADQVFDVELIGGELSDERRKELEEASRKGRADIRRKASFASFIISERAGMILRKLDGGLFQAAHTLDLMKAIDLTREHTESALNNLRAEAMRDLGIAPMTTWRRIAALFGKLMPANRAERRQG
jgi:hypothetical protein